PGAAAATRRLCQASRRRRRRGRRDRESEGVARQRRDLAGGVRTDQAKDARLRHAGGTRLRCLRARVKRKAGPGRSIERREMAIGPVQLIVLGFTHPNFQGEIIAELERLRENDTVRVIDALAVHKDADGEMEVQHLSNLSKDEAIELGTKVGALIGLGIEGEEGIEEGAAAGAEATAEGV